MSTIEVHDILGADEDEAAQKVLDACVDDYLRELQPTDLHCRKYDKTEQNTEQMTEFETTTNSIWNDLQRIHTESFDTLNFDYVHTRKEQEALSSAIRKRTITKAFLRHHITRKWEAIRDEGEKERKKQNRQKTAVQKAAARIKPTNIMLASMPSAEETTTDVS